MKKLLTSMLLTLCVCATAGAETFSVGDLTYETQSSGNYVNCLGLSAAGKKKLALELVVPRTVTYNGTSYEVNWINAQAFKDYTNIISANISARNIGGASFLNATSISTVTIDSETIGVQAFDGCHALNTVNFTNIKSIGFKAFRACKSLSRITLPAGATNVDGSSFYGAWALQNIYVDSANPNFSSHNGILYNKDKTTLVYVPQNREWSESIFTDNCTTIGSYAFGAYEGGTNYIIPYGVTTIAPCAFNYSDAVIISLPSTIKTIGTKAFNDCETLTDLYINSPTPPEDGGELLAGKAATPNLHVPRGAEAAYKAAKWTGFKSYNQNNVVGCDYIDGKYLCYTVTSSKNEKINNTDYNGRAEVVRSVYSSSVIGEITVPEYITLRNKKYAVTRIDNYGFGTGNGISVKGCALVDTVGVQAFGNQNISSIELPYVSVIEESAFGTGSLKNVKWGYRLRSIGRYGFSAAPIENDIYLPVGFENLGYRAFEQAKSKILLIPSTLKTIDAQAFNKMKSLETIIANSPVLFRQSFAFTEVPTSATVYVPVGNVSIAKANGSWKRFASIAEGSYDFSYGGDFNTAYKMTVVSNVPTKYDGVQYAGTAKYVYNPLAHAVSSYTPDAVETDKMTMGERKYVMTEIGDSLFAGAQITKFEFERMKYLARIGRRAFYNSRLSSATLPTNPMTFGEDAFYGSTQLSELVAAYPFASSIKFEGRPFGNNASDFNFFVSSTAAHSIMRNLGSYSYYGSEKCDNRVAPCFTAAYTTFPLGVAVPLDFTNSGVTAYAVTGYDSSTGMLETVKWGYTNKNDGGVILTDLTPGKFYKIRRWFTDYESSTPGLLKNTTSAMTLTPSSHAYEWDFVNKKFNKVTSSYYMFEGFSYLVLNNPASELYLDIFPAAPQGKKGDVNGDGTIDVTDVNLAINVMLGKDSKSQYPAADVNGDGTVDVTDVNLIINAMLGK